MNMQASDLGTAMRWCRPLPPNTYDILGNLSNVTDTMGNATSLTYDSLSRKTAMVDPDMGAWSYVYDAAGNLSNQTDAKGQVITFTYKHSSA